jgi:high-affinity iron transporter
VLPTFVIGLREGVEAALIVGIIAAFLVKEGRRDALRPVWIGVGAAVALCLALGVALQILDQELPEKEQDGLEATVAFVAVGMVTWMVVWMRRNAASLAGELRSSAAGALAQGSVTALVVMAFLAIVREGVETAVFLLAAFQNASNPTPAGLGVVLGLACAVVIGVGLYRGGTKLDLARFFRFTAVVLVLVAAGLISNGLHSAHEAGWVNFGQSQALDLSWLVVPGTWTSSLLTGMLGLQPQPVVAEVIGYLVYAVPMLLFVLWPRRRPEGRRPVRRRGLPSRQAQAHVGADASLAGGDR